MKSRWLLGVVVAAPLLLSGCVASVENFSGAPEDFAGEPGGESDSGLQAFWLHDGAQLAITIYGSSTCPYVVSSISVVDKAGEGNRISADVPALPDRPCTMDYVPHTTVFSTPGAVTTTEPLTIQVQDKKIVLPVK